MMYDFYHVYARLGGVATARATHAYFKAVGANLRRLRERRGWTLEQTEEHGWAEWKALQRIEQGQNVTLATLLKLGDLYQMEPWELLKGIR